MKEKEKKDKSESNYSWIFMIIFVILFWFWFFSGDSTEEQIQECEYIADDCFDNCFYKYGIYAEYHYYYFECEDNCGDNLDECIDEANSGWW